MDTAELRESISGLREEWRLARAETIARKNALLAAGADTAALRRDRVWRDCRRRTRGITTRIRHLERRLNRKLAHEAKKS